MKNFYTSTHRLVGLFFLLLFITTSNTSLQAQVEYFLDGPVRQLDFVEPQPSGLSMVGYIPLATINPTNDFYFINIFLYVPGPDTIVWVGQNILVPPDNLALGTGEPYVLTYIEFDLAPLNIFPADLPQLLPQIDLALPPPTLQPYLEPIPIPSPSNFQPFGVELDYHFVLPNQFLPEFLLNPILPHVFPPGPFTPWIGPFTAPPTFVARGCNVPNIDLSNHDHPASGTYAGDLNACVPAGTANSFMWLRKQHMAIDSLLKIAHGVGDTAHRNALEDISGKMNRANGQGVTSFNHAKGKQTFVDMYQLPVKVKYQSILFDTDILSGDDRYGHAADNQNTENGTVDPCWIINELDEDEDVELNYVCIWIDSMGNVRPDNPVTPNNESVSYGHCVTLVGGYKIPILDNITGLRFKHDIHQDSLTGLRMEWSGLAKTTIGGMDYVELTGKSGRKIVSGGVVYTRRCIVTDAMSESYCATVSYDTIPCVPSLSFNGDTLCTGVIKADTICLANVVVKGGQDILFKCSVIKAVANFTQLPPTSTLRVDNSGCD